MKFVDLFCRFCSIAWKISNFITSKYVRFLVYLIGTELQRLYSHVVKFSASIDPPIIIFTHSYVLRNDNIIDSVASTLGSWENNNNNNNNNSNSNNVSPGGGGGGYSGFKVTGRCEGFFWVGNS